MEKYPRGTFGHEPFFADRIIGECDSVEEYLQKNTMQNGKNTSPALLFLIPLDIKVLKQRCWQNF